MNIDMTLEDRIVTDALEKVGENGIIIVEESTSSETMLDLVKGIQFDRGYLSPYLVTDTDRMEAVLEDAIVLIHEKKIISVAELVPVLELTVQQDKPLLIIAEDVTGSALATAVVNKTRGIIRCAAVKAPGYGDRRKAILEDIAVLTNGRVISEELGINLENTTLNDLGSAKRVVITRDNTTIIEGAGTTESIQRRIDQIRRQIEDTTSDYDKEKLQERLAKLVLGVAVITIGATTEVEKKEKKDRVEEALHKVITPVGSTDQPFDINSAIDIITDAYEKVGTDRAIFVEEGVGISTDLDMFEGMQFDRGYLSPDFVTDSDQTEAVLEDAIILIHEEEISSGTELVPAFELTVQQDKPLLIIAEDVTGDALDAIVANKVNGTIRCAAVKAPGYGEHRTAMLEDIAVLTGGRVLSEGSGITLESIALDDLGRASRISINKDNTMIIGGAGSIDAILERRNQILVQIDETTSDYNREKLQERFTKLAVGVAVITVGATTVPGIKKNKTYVENTLEAARTAVVNGATTVEDLRISVKALLGVAADNVDETTVPEIKENKASMENVLNTEDETVNNIDGQLESSFFARLQSFRVPWMFDRLSTEHLVISVPSNVVADVVPKVSGMIAQILATYPPGMVRFLLIDPVGLGQNFASFHALSDHDEKLITNRVWSDRRHIRERLEEIIAHIEGVLQTYLRADFESIDQYNEQAGNIAEAYRFIFIYDFPENFDSETWLALERIMVSGPRCGVHVVMVWDESKELPHGARREQIIQRAQHYKMNGNELRLIGLEPKQGVSVRFTLDTSPKESIISEIVKNHGRLVKVGASIEIPYEQLMQRVLEENHDEFTADVSRNEELADVSKNPNWDSDSSGLDSARQLIAPLGPSGTRSIQKLIFARGTTVHHALLIGRIGSGKSNLLHVMIVSLAEMYSPEELEIFLVDFKKGVEFKDYAVHRLPHARVVAIESELEFGLSVLRGMDAEMTRRGEVFRFAAVQEIDDYREKTGDPMSRLLLIVDEFHELFADEGAASQEALNIVERIARQGRSFGMHMILASQSISGLRLPRAILDQIGARIAMQCSDADSRTVFADDNGAARFLERPGQGFYNDQNGLLEGNSRFQAAYLAPADRNNRLVALRELADNTYSNNPKLMERFSGPFVFEGSEPADFRACRPLSNILSEQPNTQSSLVLNLWVGEPISMSPAHAIALKRQSGANLLVIDRNEELAFGVVFSSVLSIAAQESPERVVFHLVDMSSADASWVNHSETFANNFPHQADVYARRDLETVISEVAQEIVGRELSDTKQASKIVLVLFGVQRARNLRREAGISFASPSNGDNVHDNLSKILEEGPEFGIHTIIWCDTLQSFSRIFDNSDLNEIGHRISGVLSTNDSVKLFEEPVASNLDQENRMICYDDEKIGVYTSIRPYRPCDLSYIKELGEIQSNNWEKLNNA